MQAYETTDHRPLTTSLPPTTDHRPLTTLLFAGWLGIHLVVFSFAKGIFHPYYLIVVAPSVAALGGIAVQEIARWLRADAPFTPGRAFAVSGIGFATALWEIFLIRQANAAVVDAFLLPCLILAAIASLIVLMTMRRPTQQATIKGDLTAHFAGEFSTENRLGMGLCALAGILLLAPSFYWSFATTQHAGENGIPSAGPEKSMGMRDEGRG